MLYKINIEGKTLNLYFDSVDKWIYFFNEINYSFGLNVLNPFKYNSESYNRYNHVVIEKLKLYDDKKRSLFEKHIEKCIENKNYHFCSFNGLDFTIEKTNLNLNDYEIVY